MKCLNCGKYDYIFDDVGTPAICADPMFMWECPGCCDESLSKSAYEKIEAMQAVIAKLPVGYDDKPLVVGCDIYAESPETGELTRGRLIGVSDGLLFDSYKGEFTIIWTEGDDGNVWECGNLECHSATDKPNCTTAQPCGHCPRCKGSEAENDS